MRQIAHLFRKDLEHLWPFVSGVMVIVALHAFYVTHLVPGSGVDIRTAWAILSLFASLSPLLLPLCIGAMTVVVIQQEPLTGPNAFWLTRPYSRFALLSEKALFVSVFGLLPLIVHDLFAVAWFKLSILAAVPVICVKSLEFGAVLGWVAALAVLTPNFARFTVLLVGAPVASWVLLLLFGNGTNNWGLLTALPGLSAFIVGTAGAALLILHQYRTRRTRWSGAIGVGSLAGAVIMYSLFPWSAAWRLHNVFETPAPGLDGVQLIATLDGSNAVLTNDVIGNQSQLPMRSVVYLFQVAGIPQGISLNMFRADGELTRNSTALKLTPSMFPIFRGGDKTQPDSRGIAANKQFIFFESDHDAVWRLNPDSRVTLAGSLYFQAYRDLPAVRMPLQQHEVTVWLGQERCQAASAEGSNRTLRVRLSCAQLEPASGLLVDVLVRGPDGQSTWNFTGQSATGEDDREVLPALLSPLNQSIRDYSFQPSARDSGAIPAGATVTLTPRVPAGLLRRDFRITNVRLGDLEWESWKQRGTANFPR